VLLVHTEEAVVRSRYRPVWQRTLVRAQVLDAVTRSESAVLALRRQTTGPGGRLFPALDADLWLPPPGSIPPGCRWPGSTGLRWVPWARAWTGRSRSLRCYAAAVS
jgi:hypothetical protein